MDKDDQNPDLMPPGLRRVFTLRSNAARQVAVNFMPSRQLPYNTLKMRRSNSDHDTLLQELMSENPEGQSSETQAEIIVREMEMHQQLMEDNPEAEGLRREALRDLPQGLTMKRHVRAKLSASVSLRSKHRPLSFWKRMKYRVSFAIKRSQNRLRNWLFSIEPWYEAIRKLEGNFGSAVGSYFYFLRWLVCANAVLLALLVSFVVVPQALFDVGTGRNNGSDSIGFVDFISGRGYLEKSLLFYGHYSASHETPGMRYNLTFAYFFTMLCLYLIFFAVLCYRTAYSYRVNFIETGGNVRHVFANKVFSGWDFGIASEHAAALNASSIYNELKELLSEQDRKAITTPVLTKIGQYLANTILTTIVLTVIGGLLYGLWKLLSLGDGMTRWDIVVSSVAAVCVSVCPMFFTAVVRLEYYTPRVALYVTLGRTWLLDISTLGLLLVFWSRKDGCWETSFGQEAYRLVILESCFSLVLLPIFEFIRSSVFKLHPNAFIPEFNIAYNSLTLIFNQAVLWFGAVFSPLLAVCIVIKFVLLFYVKRAVALYASVPAKKVWRAAQTQTVMYMLVTLSLFVALFSLGTLYLSHSSHTCGPFTDYETVFSVLTEGVLNLSEHDTVRGILIFVTRPGVIGFLLLFLCVAVYYVRAKSLAQRSMVEILRQMLVLEAKDKDFLLSAIAKVSNGEWMYSPRNEDAPMENSHTWKYLNDENLRKPSNAGFHLDVSRLSHSERPRSYVREGPSYREGDGDTDSSFSWQGSSRKLNDGGDSGKKWL